MTRPHAPIGLLLLGLVCGTSFAAEPPATDSATSESAESEDATTGAPTGTGPSPDIFVPTEEISEDFAVPFPVDI